MDGFPFSFKCQRTGNCCSRPKGVVRVSQDDVRRIARHVGLSEAAFRSRYVHPHAERLVDGQGPSCVFLENEGGNIGCAIYPVRPRHCATWPFWDELRDDPNALRQAMRFCPGIVPD